MKMKLYIKELIKDINVGAITSTSYQVVKKLTEKINFIEANIIVEYGPGNGVITKILLENMNCDADLYVFETNMDFVNNLCKIKDARLFIINDDAANAKKILKNMYNIKKVDYIISTIPFTLIEKRKRRRIIYKSFSLLNDKGRFITYQYSLLIYNLVKRQFKNVKWKFVLFNLPPVIIIDGIK